MLPLLALAALLQGPQMAMKTSATDGHMEASRMARAVRAAVSPVIDGRDDDAVWANAMTITDFREWRPTENEVGCRTLCHGPYPCCTAV